MEAKKCPRCERELFTMEQCRAIKERLQSITKKGDEVEIYVEVDKIIIEKPA